MTRKAAASLRANIPNWNGNTTAIEKTISQKTVTYDFARLMEGATEVKCSEFADEMIRHM